MEEKSREKDLSIKSTEEVDDSVVSTDKEESSDRGSSSEPGSSSDGEISSAPSSSESSSSSSRKSSSEQESSSYHDNSFEPDKDISRIQSELPPHLEVISLIGIGGMGSVYKIRDKNQDAIFALKLIREELAHDQTTIKRFLKEAESISKLSHPEIVNTFTTGETEAGIQYMIMEYVDGSNLQKYVKENGPLPQDKAINLFMKLCDAMIYAHQEKVIHRDLKPGNVLVEEKDSELHPKIVDFGIAKILSTTGGTAETLTSTGEIFGSPSYMSPEQCVGHDLDERSDIYSMGCLMYHCLTGKPPYESDTPLQTAFLHIKAELPVMDSKIDNDMKTVIAGTMAKNPRNRYKSMKSLLEDLQRIAAGEKPHFKPVSLKSKSTLHPIFVCASILLVAGLMAASYFILNKVNPEKPVVRELVKPEEVNIPTRDKLHTASTATLLKVVSMVGEQSGWNLEEKMRFNHSPSAFAGLQKVNDVTRALVIKGESSVPEITAGLYHKSGLVRRVCCDALKKIGASTTPIVVNKIEQSEKTNKYVIEFLHKFSDQSLTILIEKAVKATGKEQLFLTQLIANIAASTNKDITGIKNLEQLALKGTTEECRYLATLLLVRQTSFDKSTIDTIETLLSKDKSPSVRAAAASSLGAILQSRSFEKTIINSLARALHDDPITKVRFSAAVNLAANYKLVDTKNLTPDIRESDYFIKQALLTALAMKDGPKEPLSLSSTKDLLERNIHELNMADLQALYSFFHKKTSKPGHAFNLLQSAYGGKHAGFTLSYLMSYLGHDGLSSVAHKKYIYEDIGLTIYTMKKSNYPAEAWLLIKRGESEEMLQKYFKQINNLDLLEK